MQSRIQSQFRSITPVILIAYLVTFLSLLIVIIISTSKDIALDTLTKDPTETLNAPFYIGAFSNLGIMLWSGAAILCLFTAFHIRGISFYREDYQFLIVSALLTIMLTLDDLFLVHEEVFPKYFNIPENAVILTYINIFIIYLILFRKKILSSEFLILALAFFFIGMAKVSDLLPLPIKKDTFLEDAIKLFGIVSWFIYFYRFNRKLFTELQQA
jgi:hypothetical protein